MTGVCNKVSYIDRCGTISVVITGVELSQL